MFNLSFVLVLRPSVPQLDAPADFSARAASCLRARVVFRGLRNVVENKVAGYADEKKERNPFAADRRGCQNFARSIKAAKCSSGCRIYRSVFFSRVGKNHRWPPRRCGGRNEKVGGRGGDSRPRLRGIASRSSETVQLLCIHRDLVPFPSPAEVPFHHSPRDLLLPL